MLGKRLLGIPHGFFKGARRVLALGQRRAILHSESSPIKDTPSVVNFVRSLPHMEPPPAATYITFLKERLIVPPATLVGVNGGFFQPGEISMPNLYTVPDGYRFEIKKFLIEPLDTQYDTLFCAILHNGFEVPHVQGPHRLPSDRMAHFIGGGWELLPNFPQDQFNTELRIPSNDWVGVRVINDSFAEREVNIAIWGWKYPEKNIHEYVGMR